MNSNHNVSSSLTIEKIFEHFNSLNSDQSHFVNSNDICTPMECVKEMVDSIPDEFWSNSNLKVLDPCCGNGNFHAYIQTKTILSNLHFNEINPKRIKNLKEFFGSEINLTRQDFLTDFSIDGQWDLVVANPPYAKFTAGKRASKNHNMSRAFIEKALRVTKSGGYLLFIVPDNWMSFSDRNDLPSIMSQYQFRHLNIHGAKKWFPGVGSSFTWFLLQKKPNQDKFTVTNHYKKQKTTKVKLDSGIDFIPLYYDKAVRSLMNKTVNDESLPKYKVETTSDLHRFTKKELISETEDVEHPFRLIHTPKQTVWSSREHKFQKGWKVFLSLSDRYGAFVDNCGMTQSVAFVRCKTKKEAEKICAELNDPMFRGINNMTRYGNFNNIRVLQHLPKLGTFKLTKAERDIVDFFAEVL